MAQARDRATMAREVLEQDTREKGDYEAITPTREEAERIVLGASDYIAAVEQMLET
ncbi:MAG TPA: hypothetical protein VHT25_08295 [Solirubrobacteraceae bacterium]|jgi:hypothetical protein|nr:hypothetical protein [Solirubrobacteraceae bacterium]